MAAQSYLDLARRTRDARIARRAAEMAVFARQTDLASDASRLMAGTRSHVAAGPATGLRRRRQQRRIELNPSRVGAGPWATRSAPR